MCPRLCDPCRGGEFMEPKRNLVCVLLPHYPADGPHKLKDLSDTRILQFEETQVAGWHFLVLRLNHGRFSQCFENDLPTSDNKLCRTNNKIIESVDTAAKIKIPGKSTE